MLSQEEREKLVVDNMGLVYSIARKYVCKTTFSLDDLVYPGIKALVKASNCYDASNGGAKFSTYAYKAISRSIVTEIDHLLAAKRSGGKYDFVSLDDYIDDEKTVTFGEIMPDEKIDVQRDFELADLVARIFTVLLNTGTVEECLIFLMHIKDKSLSPICSMTKKSRFKVEKILKKWIEKLKNNSFIGYTRDNTWFVEPDNGMYLVSARGNKQLFTAINEVAKKQGMMNRIIDTYKDDGIRIKLHSEELCIFFILVLKKL